MKSSNIICLFVGIAIGGAGGWFVAKKRYAAFADEEIKSVKEAYANKPPKIIFTETPTENDSTTQEEIVRKAQNKPDLNTYKEIVQESKASDTPTEYGKQYRKEETKATTPVVEAIKDDGPYVISPDSVGEIDGYDVEELTYYSDGIICDDNDEVISYPERYIGEDFESKFGEYEPDAAHIRNDKLKTDYEILRDPRTYEMVVEGVRRKGRR